MVLIPYCAFHILINSLGYGDFSYQYNHKPIFKWKNKKTELKMLQLLKSAILRRDVKN